MFRKVYPSWAQFKNLITSNAEFQWNFIELDQRYDLFGVAGGITFECTLLKDSGIDQQEFEADYKADADMIFKQHVRARLQGKKANGAFADMGISDDGKLKVETTPSSAPGTQQEIIIVDADDPTKKGKVDSGRQLVSTQPPPAPPGSTSIIEIIDDTFNNNEFKNYFYTVTDEKTIELQRFSASGVAIQNGWTVELYKDPYGEGSQGSPIQANWELVALIVIPEGGYNYTEDLKPDTLSGDGIARLVIRISRLGGGGGGKRAYAKFVGYEV